MAKTIQSGLKAMRPEMEKILAKGYVRLSQKIKKSPLSGKKICFTGELKGISRTEASAMVREGGGLVKNSVTADLDYLVTDDPSSGSSKNRKAKELGIAIISGPEFLAIAHSES
jgi:DNA ligase (NAD+)